jgi:hypothetical protein
MMSQYNTHLKFILTMLLCSIVGGCATLGTTTPNAPHQGPYPDSFAILAQKNSLLGEELAKLPEFQDGISDTEAAALETIVTIYIDNPVAFDMAFDQMFQIGIPKVRKYCSPLQALFWMTEDGKHVEITRLISNYSLDSLLGQAWIFVDLDITHYKHKYLELSDEQAKQIVAALDGYEKRRYEGSQPEIIKLLLLTQYNEDPNIFPRKQRKIIQRSIRISESYLKWTNFDIVVERLNAPELLDYYINNNISYKKNSINSHTSKHTFSHHWGDCDDLAVFGEYILRKGGYKVFPRYVHWTANNRGHVGVVIELEDGGYFLAVDFDGSNSMTGPYTEMSEVDEMLSHGNTILDSGWYRPRH